VEQVNQEVTGKPELLNEDPYNKGWLLIIKPSNMDELKNLMDAATAAEWHKTLNKEAK
jgi:glycine cleavage system H protein